MRAVLIVYLLYWKYVHKSKPFNVIALFGWVFGNPGFHSEGIAKPVVSLVELSPIVGMQSYYCTTFRSRAKANLALMHSASITTSPVGLREAKDSWRPRIRKLTTISATKAPSLLSFKSILHYNDVIM
jgi:hypothetical protein